MDLTPPLDDLTPEEWREAAASKAPYVATRIGPVSTAVARWALVRHEGEDGSAEDMTVTDEDGNLVYDEAAEARAEREKPLREAVAALRELIVACDQAIHWVLPPEVSALLPEARRIVALYDTEV